MTVARGVRDAPLDDVRVRYIRWGHSPTGVVADL